MAPPKKKTAKKAKTVKKAAASKKATSAPKPRSASPAQRDRPLLQPLNDAWTLHREPSAPSFAAAAAVTAPLPTSTPNKKRCRESPDATALPLPTEGWPAGLPTQGLAVLDEATLRAENKPERRAASASASSASSSDLPVMVELAGDTSVFLIARQESGAISFHFPTRSAVPHPADSPQTKSRRSRRGAETQAQTEPTGAANTVSPGKVRLTFDVAVSRAAPERARRGLISKAVKVILVKVVDAAVGSLVEHAAEWAVPLLATQLEKKLWEKRTQGWLRVTPQSLAAQQDVMTASLPSFRTTERGLLLIHGTFSSTHGGYKNLAGTDFFQQISSLYGANIYAFNHFTISKTPGQNVKDMLDALPDQDFHFDVITHSRGGLVVRELLERSGRDHPKGHRLKIGKVIMVASPSVGTPLASPAGWDRKLSFMANVLEMLPVPENPFTTGASWLAEALKWVAGNVLGHCSGLVAMDPESPYIDELKGPPDEPAGTQYHALVSNFQPPRGWLPRLGDMALDTFFGGANDLVVPTEGGWQTADEPTAWIPAPRVACFGPGGNLQQDSTTAIHHGSFFGHPDSIAFIVGALTGQPIELPRLDLEQPLGSRSLTGRRTSRISAAVPAAVGGGAAGGGGAAVGGGAAGGGGAGDGGDNTPNLKMEGWVGETNTLYLTAISSGNPAKFDPNMPSTLLLAQCGNARVMQPLYTRNVHDDDTKGKHTVGAKNNARKTSHNPLRDLAIGEIDREAGNRFMNIITMQRFMVEYTNGKKSPCSILINDKWQTFTEPNEIFLQILGTYLFESLFVGQVRRLYDAVQHRHSRRRVNIIFTSMLSWLADLPWELAFDPGAQNYLATSNVRFLRNVLSPNQIDQVDRVERSEHRRTKLRILVASAQPTGSVALSIEQERERILDSFLPLTERGLAEVVVIPRVTPELLHCYLRSTSEQNEFDVFHFIGHGAQKDEIGGTVEFEDENGLPCDVSAMQLMNILRNRGIRIVFLNACETGRGASEASSGYNKGIAMLLTHEGIPAVVANQYSVVDSLASLFSLHFYNCLAHGLTLADSMREARIAVSYSADAEPMDWGVPVLFSSCPQATICERRPFVPDWSKERAMMAQNPAARRSAIDTDRRLKVAVWCTSFALTYREKLAQTLDEMTAAQTEFSFHLKERSVPAYLWRRDEKSGYLPANSIFPELNTIRNERFKTDFLFVITDLPVKAGSDTALYYLSYPVKKENKVVLFSTWGFDPPLEGLALKTALASHAALGLLSDLSGLGIGDDRDTPEHPIHTIGHYNDNRSVEHITQPMSITTAVNAQLVSLTKDKNNVFTAKQYTAAKALLNLYK